MNSIIYRQNKLFKIDDSQINATNKREVCNALYAAIYSEFRGASENPIYRNLSNLERLQAVNTFATNWLKSKGYI
jgi:hypothetical protein